MADVPLRKLGANGPLVPSLGFGCMGLSSSYGPVGEDEARFKVLDKAHELGSRLWDTSDVCKWCLSHVRLVYIDYNLTALPKTETVKTS